VPCLYKYSGTPFGAQSASVEETRCLLVCALTNSGCKTTRNFSRALTGLTVIFCGAQFGIGAASAHILPVDCLETLGIQI